MKKLLVCVMLALALTICALTASADDICTITTKIIGQGELVLRGANLISGNTYTIGYGQKLEIDYSHPPGWIYYGLKINGVSYATHGDIYIIESVTADLELEAEFREYHYINASASAGGKINPDGSKRVFAGTSQTYKFTPDYGYKLDGVLVDDVRVTDAAVYAKKEYTFTNVSAGHTIEAEFVKDTWAVTTSIIGSGSLTLIDTTQGITLVADAAGIYEIQRGNGLLIQIVYGKDYDVYKMTIGGTPISVHGSHTIERVNYDTSIAVEFREYRTIEAGAGENGSISPSGSVKVFIGESQIFKITPNEGCELDVLLADGVDVTSDAIRAAGEYTFTNVSANHEITASFRQKQYTIKATAGEHGSIDPSGDIKVAHGGSQKFTFKPDEDYEIYEVLVDGVNVFYDEVYRNLEYTFTNVTGDHEITVNCRKIEYITLTATAGEGGSIEPSGVFKVRKDSYQMFTAIPDAGNKVAYIRLSGFPDGIDQYYSVNSLTINNLVYDIQIHAEFAPVGTHTIHASAGAGGSISPSGKVTINEGENQTFVITPERGYEIADVLVDRGSIDPVDSYTFEDVRSGHTIRVVFSPLPSYTITASAGDGGKIEPSGDITVYQGESLTFTIEPEEFAEILDIKIDGVSMGTVDIDTFTFVDISASYTIEVVFNRLPTATITTSCNEGGVIEPSGAIRLLTGSDITFNFHPGYGQQIAGVWVDGQPIGAIGSYTFTDIQQDADLRVEFEKIPVPPEEIPTEFEISPYFMALIKQNALEFPDVTGYTHLIIHKNVYIYDADGDVKGFIPTGNCLSYLGQCDLEDFELVEDGYAKSAGALPVNINAMKIGVCTAEVFNIRVAPDMQAIIIDTINAGRQVYVAAIDYRGWGLILYGVDDSDEMRVGYAYLESFDFDKPAE